MDKYKSSNIHKDRFRSTPPPIIPPKPKFIPSQILSKYPQLNSNKEYIILNVNINKSNKPYGVLLDVSSDLIKNCADAYQNNNNIKIIDKIISNGNQGVIKYGCNKNDSNCDRYIIKISFEIENNIKNINKYGEVYINNLIKNEPKIKSPKLLGYFACPIYDNESIITTINSMAEKGIEYDYNYHTHILYQVYETVYSNISNNEIISKCKYNINNIIGHNILLIKNEIYNLDMHVNNMIIDKNNNINFIDYGYSYTIDSYLYQKFGYSFKKINNDKLKNLIDQNIYSMDLRISMTLYSFAVILISNNKCFENDKDGLMMKIIIGLIFVNCIQEILNTSNRKYNSNEDKNNLEKKFNYQITYNNPYMNYNKNNNLIRMFDIFTLNLNNNYFKNIINKYIELYRIFGMKIKEYIKNNNLTNLLNNEEFNKVINSSLNFTINLN